MTACEVCFRRCRLEEGMRGFCGARVCRDGHVVPENYGKITSLALDPIEKKPLRRFFPGSRILSVGSYGCNLRCPFCQNYEISYGRPFEDMRDAAETVTPEELTEMAARLLPEGNIGVAFTYNEPLAGYEFVRDTAKCVRERGMKNVLVTNGTAALSAYEEIAPYIDAMNIDLKSFSDTFYSELLHGDRKMVLDLIEAAAARCHVEVTCLIIPGENDGDDEIRALAGFLAGLHDGRGRDIPLHVSRFFPTFHMTDRGPTPVETVYRLAETARDFLTYVYTGNC